MNLRSTMKFDSAHPGVNHWTVFRMNSVFDSNWKPKDCGAWWRTLSRRISLYQVLIIFKTIRIPVWFNPHQHHTQRWWGSPIQVQKIQGYVVRHIINCWLVHNILCPRFLCHWMHQKKMTYEIVSWKQIIRKFPLQYMLHQKSSHRRHWSSSPEFILACLSQVWIQDKGVRRKSTSTISLMSCKKRCLLEENRIF